MLFLLGWVVRIDGGSDDRCYGVLLAPDGNPVVFGNYANSVYAAKLLASDGAFSWQYIFAFPGDGRSNAKAGFWDPTDSSLVLGGTAYPYSGDDQACGFVAKIRGGTTLWMYVDSADGCSRREGFSGVTRGSDGQYYAYGTDYETYSADFFTPSRRFVLKLDRNTGLKLWRYQPGGYSYTAAASSDDGVVAVGFGAEGEAQKVGLDGGEIWTITPRDAKFWNVAVASTGHPVVVGRRDGDFYVAQLQRESGGIRWERYFNGSANDDESALRVIAVGEHIYAAGYLDNGINDLDGFLVKLDTLGNILWSFTYNSPYNYEDSLSSLAFGDGTLVVGGSSKGWGTGWDILLFLADTSSGDTLWSYRYDSPYALDDFLAGMAIGNGKIFLCGTSYSSPTNRDIVVVGMDLPTLVNENSRHVPFFEVRGNRVMVEFTGRVEVFDPSGRSFWRGVSNGRLELKLRRGVWFIRIEGRTYKLLIR
ncbi:MAG: PQQ-like beta-propeller repeat protein [Thermotogae bacterium]|nr:PQQ-like beta-propeller repeat protein [Thermotogota bacterium]